MRLLKQLFLTGFLLITALSYSQNTPESIVQANLEAYIAHDLEKFMSFFSEDVQLVNFQDGVVRAQGKAEIRAIYEPYFEASPKLHSKILKRTIFD